MISAEQVRFELNAQPVDYVSRFLQTTSDYAVSERLKRINFAEEVERSEQIAQLLVYLAAAHTLFPEESMKLYDFVKPEYELRGKNG